MANNFTNYSGKVILEYITGRTATPAPTHTYLALYTVAPTDSTVGTEVSGGNYARIQLAWGAANEETGEIATTAAARFPAAGNSSADWGTIVALGITDAVTSGHILAYAPLKPTFTINSGEFFRVVSGGIALALS